MTDKPLILLGGGGHAGVLADLIILTGRELIGYCAPLQSTLDIFKNIAYLGDDSTLADNYSCHEVQLVNGIGMLPGSSLRQSIYEAFSSYSFAVLVHPSATVSSYAVLAPGVQVMAGAVVQAGANVEDNVIINTMASVDHDCLVKAHTHLAVAATLCGDVHIGAGCFVGAGATIIQQIHIGSRAVIAAGAIVTKGVPASSLFLGGLVSLIKN